MTVIALVVLFILFWISGDGLAKYSTLVSIFDSSYYIDFVIIDVTFATITGGIGLSIGTVCTCYSLILGTLYIELGLPVSLCVTLVILMGGLFGPANGFVISVTRFPAFIATPGTMVITRGLGSIVTDTTTTTLLQASAPGGSFRGIFKLEGAGLPQASIPTGLIPLIIPIIPMAVLLNKTCPRCYILSLGSSKEVTRFPGINVVRWKTLAYVTSGLFAGLVGVSYTAVYSALMPGTGNGFELDTVAGVVIGGMSLAGGVGSISRTLIGVFITSALKTGPPFVGVQPHYQLLIIGFVLIVAILVGVLNKRKQGKN